MNKRAENKGIRKNRRERNETSYTMKDIKMCSPICNKMQQGGWVMGGVQNLQRTNLHKKSSNIFTQQS